MKQSRIVKYIPFGEERTDLFEKKIYHCNYEWEKNISLQCGSNGIVFKKEGGGYSTAFFEIFYGQNFIRGEGKTIDEAEASAYLKYKQMIDCKSHHFEPEKNSPRNGKCTHCGYIQKDVYLPKEICTTCQKPHVILSLNDKNYCLKHYIEETKKIDLKLTPEKINEFKKIAFEKIIKSRGGDNLIDMMISKDSKNKKIEKWEDIESTNFYFEMEVDKLKEMKQDLAIYKIIEASKISDLFEEECFLIDLINEFKSKSKTAAFKYTINLVNELIERYKEEGIIKSDQNNDLNSIRILDKISLSDIFFEIEEYAFYCLLFELIEKEYPQVSNFDIFEQLYGLNKKEKLSAMYFHLQTKMLKIINNLNND